jgi:predicted nucleotidyltransferase
VPIISENVWVNSTRVEVTNGKVLYDGESLVVWASRVAARIVERCGPSRVILYGSVARGDDGPDSDIDLLVVMPIVGRRHSAAVLVLNELRDFPVPIDITVVDLAHLDKEANVPGLVRAAMWDGRDLATQR